jgi:Zn-dependent peptidase ImmA (M78 family)/DNA-binding XRE family transcriptional regulator
MLRLRRQLRKLSQAQLARLVGMNQGHLSKIESGILDPPEGLIKRLSEKLDCPPSFFLHSDRVYGLPVSVHPMFRKRSTASKRELDRIHAELNVRLIHIRRLLEAVEINAKARLPQLDIDEYDGDIETIADLVRRTWLLPPGPIEDLTNTVEEAGCIVIHCDFPSGKVDGVTMSVPGLPPCIFLNRNQPADRMRFSLAHEIGHLVLHELPTPEMEDQANAFAAAFLMPAADIRSQFGHVTIKRLAFLKKVWRVAMAALLMRAKRLGVVNESQNQYLWRQMSRAGYRTREPASTEFPEETPGVLPEIIRAHLEELGYSIRELSEVLSMHEHEFRDYYGFGGGHLRVVRSMD